MNRFWWLCIFLCGAFSAKAQRTEWVKADSLMVAGEWLAAQVAYERIVFRRQTPPDSVQLALLRKAQCQKMGGKPAEALQTLNRTDPFSVGSDSLAFALRYEMAVCATLNAEYAAALGLAEQARYFASDQQKDSLSAQLFLWETVALHGNADWAQARQKARQYAEWFQIPLQTDSLYSTPPKLKKAAKARMLSTFMPGTGQWYAGRPLAGMASAVLQGGSLAFGVWSALNGYYLSGFITGAGLFQAFYFGGIRHSETLAERYNERAIRQYQERLNTFLIRTEQQRNRP